jgi:hypothetical protein
MARRSWQRLYNKRVGVHRDDQSLNKEITDMAIDLTITYFVSHDMLGVPSDEEVEHFKDLLSEGLQDEWPEAQIAIEDDEDARAQISGLSGQSLQDVQDRVDDIVNEILDAGAWEEEEDSLFGEDDESTPGPVASGY